MPVIGIQGIKGCFHEMAARKHFGNEIEVHECQSFKSLCFDLEAGKADFAVMAIENTLAGSLLPNYGLIQRFGFHVIGEVYLHIQMNLMAKPGVKVEELRQVMSHPVALAQCEEFLETLPHIEVKEYHDTAAAAKWVSESDDRSVAAISNELSAELYGLEILEYEIETHKKNFTRFLVISREKLVIEGANKASLSLEVSHTPGSLADVLTIFKNHEVNLTKIQSIPIIGKPYQYAFKIDVSWSDKRNYLKALDEIDVDGHNVQVLGIYKEQRYDG